MRPLQEETAQNGSSDNQEDTRTEPRSGSFRGIGITRGELVVDFYAPDESHDSNPLVTHLAKLVT